MANKFEEELYPNTQTWNERQIVDYLEKHEPLIRFIVSRISSIPDYALDWDDLFQDALTAFWLAIITYDPGKKVQLTTYAYKCMRNAVYQTLRAAVTSKRMPAVPTVSFDSVFGELCENYMMSGYSAAPVEEQCAMNEILDFIYEIVTTQCTPIQQRVFFSLVSGRATQTEVACEMQCSQGNISDKYSRILKRIRNELRRRGFDEMP